MNLKNYKRTHDFNKGDSVLYKNQNLTINTLLMVVNNNKPNMVCLWELSNGALAYDFELKATDKFCML